MSVDLAVAAPGVPRPDVRRARGAARPGRGALRRRPACARPAAARSPRSAPRGSGLRAALVGRRSATTSPGDFVRARARAPRASRCAGPRGRAHADHRRDAGRRRARDGHLRARGEQRRAAELARARAARGRRRARPARPRARPARAATRPCGDDDARALRRPPAARPRRARARCSSTSREALLLTGDATPRDGGRARSPSRVEIVVVTLGADGALARARRRARARAPASTMEAVDTTGAGDLLVRRVRLGGPGGSRRSPSGLALGGPVRDHSRSPSPPGPRARSRWSALMEEAIGPRPAAARPAHEGGHAT